MEDDLHNQLVRIEQEYQATDRSPDAKATRDQKIDLLLWRDEPVLWALERTIDLVRQPTHPTLSSFIQAVQSHVH